MGSYLYDPHTHTKETSMCGRMSAAEIVDRYVSKGFAGIAVTDHLHPEYLSHVDKEHNWDKVIDLYLAGYHASKKRGDEVGLDVILGAELRFPENENDYLVYGIDEQWLRSNPYMCCMSARDFYKKFHDQVLIIHAHPYREGLRPCEEAVHGAELINAHPRHENHNEMALELCRRRPEFYRLAGSDTHQPGDEAHAGVILPERVRDSFAYKHMIQTMQFRLWAPEQPNFVAADLEMRETDNGRQCFVNLAGGGAK